MDILRAAADSLDRAGAPDLAERARALGAADAVGDRWTYQLVDAFRERLVEPARGLDDTVRARLTGGTRHAHEAAEKRRRAGPGARTEVDPG